MTTIDIDRSEWNRRLRARWRQGAAEYGDQSFARPFTETCRQVLEEIEDTAGWLFVAWIQARVARGDLLDLAQRERLEQDFIVAMEGRDNELDPVGSIAWIAGCQFTRWQIMRHRLVRALHAIEGARAQQSQPEETRGRRGSRNDPRSSD